MRRTVRVGVLVLVFWWAVLLPPGTARTPSLTFSGCEQLFASYPVPFAVAQAYLPPGFEAVKFTTDPTGNLGSISIYVDSCAASDAATEAGPMAEAWLLIRTSPPAPWRDPAATAHFFLYASAVSDGMVGAAYAAWDLTSGAPGAVHLVTTPVALNGYTVAADAHGPELLLRVEAVNALDDAVWPEQHIRLFGRGPGGDIGAVDQHILPGGRQSGLQASVSVHTRTPDLTADPHASPSIGRDFRWDSDESSWTLTPIGLPPLP